MSDSNQAGAAASPLVATVDVEDWFNILDSSAVPPLDVWPKLPSRLEIGLRASLELFADAGVRATMFWLGWMAERNRGLVRECHRAGHEIGSHGYAHLLPYQAGPIAFREDIRRAKDILEDITGEAVIGFRAPGFGITPESRWAFDIIRGAGYCYDASVFPAARGHGGIPGENSSPHLIRTRSGELAEFPTSVVSFGRFSFSIFGGGYLRATPAPLLLWAVRRVLNAGKPVVIYFHPRELDPGHPRLPLPWRRRFKSYFNLESTEPKLRKLLRLSPYTTMRELGGREFPLQMAPPQSSPLVSKEKLAG